MAEFAPLFTENGSVIPKNTQPLSDSATVSALAAAAIGATAGSAASATHTRVKNTADNAGKQQLETVTHINRNTTAADVTALKAELTRDNKNTKKKASFTYAKDLSGNGGPAFTRT
jgi:hypothetical protein